MSTIKTTDLPSEEFLEEYPLIFDNSWVVSKSHIFAEWALRFPVGSSAADILNILRRILNLAEKESILNLDWVQEIPKGKSEVLGDASLRHLLSLLDANSQPKGDLGFSSEVSVYKDNVRIVKEITRNLGATLRDSISIKKLTNSLLNEYSANLPPVSLSVTFPHELNRPKTTAEVAFLISTNSDIWFPYVVGYLEDFPATSIASMHDNRQLAYRHTPPLNRLLKAIREITLATDLQWVLQQTHSEYIHMVSEVGISLE